MAIGRPLIPETFSKSTICGQSQADRFCVVGKSLYPALTDLIEMNVMLMTAIAMMMLATLIRVFLVLLSMILFLLVVKYINEEEAYSY
jgi:hypothetical protein